MSPKTDDNAAAFAARFGVTVKALRVYEAEGLLKPIRTAKGWRVYGRVEEERLTAILALKRFGLPLARIGELLKGFRGDLDRVLALQEAALAQARADTEEALSLVRAARARLRSGNTLSADELVNLTKAAKMTDMQWTPDLDALSRKIYTAEELEALKARKLSALDQQRITDIWTALFTEGETLRQGDVRAEAARDWARRWAKEAEAFAPKGSALYDKAAQFNDAALKDPVTRPQMFGNPEVWDFAFKVMRAMKEDGMAV